jgi:hypothetical protein
MNKHLNLKRNLLGACLTVLLYLPQQGWSAPQAGQPPRAERDDSSDALLAEEVEGDLTGAIAKYKKVIAELEKRQGELPRMIFRLAECYRKLNRLEDAKVQYRRLAREFPLETKLMAAAQPFLQGEVNITNPTVARTGAVEGSANPKAIDLLKRQVEILDTEIQSKKRQQENGIAGTDELVALQREQLDLRRQLIGASADANNSERAIKETSELYHQEIELLQKQMAEMRKRVDAGVASPEAVLSLEKSLLSLRLKLENATSRLSSATTREPEDPPFSQKSPRNRIAFDGGRSLEFSLLNDDILRLVAQRSRLADQLDEAKREIGRTERKVQLLESTPSDNLPREIASPEYLNLWQDLTRKRNESAEYPNNPEAQKRYKAQAEALDSWVHNVYRRNLLASKRYWEIEMDALYKEEAQAAERLHELAKKQEIIQKLAESEKAR